METPWHEQERIFPPIGRTCNRFISDTKWALGGKKLLLRSERKKTGHLQLMLPKDIALCKVFK